MLSPILGAAVLGGLIHASTHKEDTYADDEEPLGYAQWDEQKHSRNHGKFSNKGGAKDGPKSELVKPEEVPWHKRTWARRRLMKKADFRPKVIAGKLAGGLAAAAIATLLIHHRMKKMAARPSTVPQMTDNRPPVPVHGVRWEDTDAGRGLE